jgi:hypothetical protein
MLPLLKKHNEKLEKDLAEVRANNARLQQAMQESQSSIEEIQKVHAEITKDAVERARREAREQLKAARESGDVETELELVDKLADLKAQEKTAQERKPPEKVNGQPLQEEVQIHPDFKAWAGENTWFGSDQRKTMLAMGIAQELRADPENDDLKGREFFDKVVEIMAERTNSKRPAQKVDGGGRPSGSGGGGGRAYADLPAEAKIACDRQGERLIGPNKMFKDQAAWRQYYSNIYFQGES